MVFVGRSAARTSAGRSGYARPSSLQPSADTDPRTTLSPVESREIKNRNHAKRRAAEPKTRNPAAAAAAAAARGPRGPSARRGGERRWGFGFGFDDAAADAEIASPRGFVRARASPRVRRRVGSVVFFFFFFAQEDGGGDEHELGAPLRGGARGVQRDGGAGGVSQERGLSDAQGVHDREGQFGLALGGVHEVGAPGGVVG